MSIMPEHEKLQDFMDYLTENYIVSESKISNFYVGRNDK
jgi:hypothetical protein